MDIFLKILVILVILGIGVFFAALIIRSREIGTSMKVVLLVLWLVVLLAAIWAVITNGQLGNYTPGPNPTNGGKPVFPT